MNEMEKEKFYITTAIAYASKKPHIGNTYEVTMTDAVARYKRARGYDVFFLTGTDEHGKKIEDCAHDAGITPQKYVDGVSGEIRGIWDLMNTSYDRFIRTTEPSHEKTIQKIFKKLYDKGDIYKGEYEGWYCIPDEASYTDTQVVDGKCPDCGRPVQRMKEETYFFRMSKYAGRLMDYLDSHPDFIEPEARKKEMVNNFLKPGLQDLCVSRTSFKWGIPVDFDPRHVVYVWIDALCNYITGIGYDLDGDGNIVPSESFEKYWPADVHIIGKDILRFHTIYWPIILMALDLPLPKKIFGHPWFNFGTEKMSKSRGNVLYADDLVKRFGVDGVRHYVLAEMPFVTDGSITYESMITRYNTDLANNLGNLVNRTVAMTKKYFDGIVPAPGEETDLDRELKSTVSESVKAYFDEMDTYHIADAVDTAYTMLRRANKYIDETAPWTLAKADCDKPRLSTVIYNLLETIRVGAALIAPFIPSTASEILSQLGTASASYEFGALEPGKPVGEARVLFSRIDEAKLLAEIEAEHAAQTTEAEPEKPEGCAQIGIDSFMNVELRTAQIIACEPVKKAKKLLKLELDLGYEKRTVASGIAKYYTPDELIGKKVIVVANLAPATLCGIESNGMILASGEEKVRVIFLDPETPLGESVR